MPTCSTREVEDLSSGEDNSLLRLIGGVLFTAYGVFNFFKKIKDTQVQGKKTEGVSSTKDYILLGLKGFLLNIANPLVIFYWFSVMTLGAEDQESTKSSTSILLFLMIILVTFFTIDFLKILGAKRLRPLVTPRLLKGLNRLIGIVFVAFGIFLIAQGILNVVTMH